MNDEKERAVKAETARKMLGFVIPAWIANCTVFISTLFLANYAEHIRHWAETPLFSMCIGSGITKAFLSVLLVMNYDAYSGRSDK